MLALEVIQIDKDVGLILPKEVLARLQAKEGDEIFLTAMPDGHHLMTASASGHREVLLDLPNSAAS
jgi:bifunctional DNA-binding transcriptional regulator/antitoxin component of YhaV-PrlF toxin-antitoxin module